MRPTLSSIPVAKSEDLIMAGMVGSICLTSTAVARECVNEDERREGDEKMCLTLTTESERVCAG